MRNPRTTACILVLEMVGSERHVTPRYQPRHERHTGQKALSRSRLSSRLVFVFTVEMSELIAEDAVDDDPKPVGHQGHAKHACPCFLIILDVPRRDLLRGVCSFGPTFVVVSAALNHIQIFQGEGMN